MPPPTTIDPDVQRELDAIEERLVATNELLELLLSFRILEAGYAKNLGEAHRIAEDRDRVLQLFAEGS